ncbi:hypothetical protein [Bradyrhizobium sp. SZCCHNS1054]|uniref:hypothetical protein n=1 Tax=Bradyrhizobium sp. SZCCHNS1054 TaxID=3057301 RepID=UPI002916C025|nr:hypothetical protein [Bradyrhizobium sp. SZCCHNS1054]
MIDQLDAEVSLEVERALAGLALAQSRFAGSGEDIFRRFFAFAASRVQAWRDLRWQGTRLATLKSLPVLERADVAANPARFVADEDCRHVVRRTTSGTTGALLTIGYDVCAQHVLNTLLYATVFEQHFPAVLAAIEPGAVSVGLVTNKPTRGSSTALLPFIGATTWRRFQLRNEAELDSLVAAEPPIIYGKPMYIRELADRLSERHVRVKPACILTSGERLYDDDRVAIGEAFGVGIVDALVTAECGIVAVSRLDQPQLQVLSDLVVVEVQTEDGEIRDQGFGELIVTSAFNWFNPFLRYRTGDVGWLHRQRDGRQAIEGVRRRKEYAQLGPLAIETRELELHLVRHGIWDYRLRVVGDCAFLIWSGAVATPDRSAEVGRLVARLLKTATCRVRRVASVTRPGAKRLRYPAGGRGFASVAT